MFSQLCADECISEDAFVFWKSSGVVQVGRNLAIENVSRFYKWFEGIDAGENTS